VTDSKIFNDTERGLFATAELFVELTSGSSNFFLHENYKDLEGKSRQGPVFDKRQHCRLLYRKRIRDDSV